MRKKIEGDTICDKCGTILQCGKEEIFCDHCKKKLTQEYPLRITVFWKGTNDERPDNLEVESVELCSWSCVIDFLRNFPWNKKRVESVTLPYIADCSMGDFTAELKAMLEAFRK